MKTLLPIPLLLALLFGRAVIAQSPEKEMPSPDILIAAHRGGYASDKKDKAPENSLANVEVAVAKGFDIYETDIQRTADGVFVVVHDPTLDRETNGSGTADQLTLEEVKKLQKRFKDGSVSEQKVATLEELLLAGKGRIRFKADLKPGVIDHFDDLAKLLHRIEMEDQVYLRTGFKDTWKIAKLFKEGTPKVEVMFKVSTAKQVQDVAERFSPKTIHIEIARDEVLSDERKAAIHAALDAGIVVQTHCYRDREQLRSLIDAGVRMFHTADPDGVLRYLREQNLRD